MSTVANGENEAARGGAWALFLVILAGFLIAGAAFGSVALFRRYGGKFARLAHTDTRLAQELYNDSVTRQLADIAIQQQDAVLNAELAAENATRYANFLELFAAINNETAARTAEELIIFEYLANETAARILIDIFFAAEIANLTAGVVAAEQYELYSQSVFAAIIANITSLQLLLANEIAARIAGDALLTEQGALADAAIAYLTTTLAWDIQQRSAQDVLINEWIAALDALGFGIQSINGRVSVGNNVDIVSTNVLTTITAPTPGTLLFKNNAILTMQGISPAAGGNIVFNGGAGIAVNPLGAYGLHITSSFVPIGPNSVYITGFTAASFGFDGQIDNPANWISVGCIFTIYNGGNCGWSAPDSSTYIVQVSVTITFCPGGVGFPTSAHVNMAFGRSYYNYAVTHNLISTENTGGILDAGDGAYIGSAELTTYYCMDVGMSATTIVQGSGIAGTGGIPNGYGVFVFLQATIQTVSATPLTVIYRVTKVP